jgi:hypothetical protein
MKLFKFQELLEYNRNLQVKIFNLKNKFPNLITNKFDKQLNDNFKNFINDYTDNTFFKHIDNFENNISDEFIDYCKNIGIDILFIFRVTFESFDDTYIDWFLYDNNKIMLCPGGGEDYLSARVIGSGVHKVAHQSRDYILKNKLDVSDLEYTLSNKYPEIFATYTNAGRYYKQEKLTPIEPEFFDDYDTLDELELKIKNIFNDENIKKYPDIHTGNVGYDALGNLKCFDFL